MTTRPILFSGPMVRAILAGTKTQTRRLVTPMAGMQSKWLTLDGITKSPRLTMARTNPTQMLGAQMDHPRGGPLGWVRCPYYQAEGDKLWVRETWRTEERQSDGIRLRADDAFVPIEPTRDAADAWIEARDNGKHGAKWRPSIFMRPWMSRISLAVTDVRVERLQDITEADARAEGVGPLGVDEDDHAHRAQFRHLWDSINGKRADWQSNPWVWVVSFTRVTGGAR